MRFSNYPQAVSMTLTADITVKKVRAFRDEVKPGSVLKYKKETVMILRKYPFIAMTDKGCISWNDLYMRNVRNTYSSDTDYTQFYSKEG